MSEVNLPEGWSVARYDDAYLSASNGTGGSQNKEGEGIPVSRIETIANENIDYKRIGFLSKYDEGKVEKHKLAIGDILFSHINSPIHLGKTAIYDGKHTLYHGINLLRIVVDRRVVLPEIFNWHCKYTRILGEFSLRAQHAVNQSSLNQKKLGEFELPLPPLAEQKVIADKLDTLLAQVETTKARLERIPQILKTFRQSVLATAVSGKLTEEWRGGSKNWSYPKIKQVGKVQLGRQRSPKYHTGENMKPYLRVQNVFEDFIDTADVMSMEFSSEDFERYRLKFGDVLLNEGQSPKFLGRPAIYRDELENACFTNTLIRFQASDLTSPEYALIVFRNHMHSGRYISEGTITTNIAHLGSGRFGNVEFPLPPKKEQTQIVRRVEELFALADRIEQKANAALERVNNLTQSILAKAFRGEITANWRAENPELISGENSAEALLTKIKAEREALSGKKKPKKKAAARKKA
jgi:type I restriction enzyme S subunit